MVVYHHAVTRVPVFQCVGYPCKLVADSVKGLQIVDVLLIGGRRVLPFRLRFAAFDDVIDYTHAVPPHLRCDLWC